MDEKTFNGTYASAQYYSCGYALILDRRHVRKGKDTYPVAMRFTIDRKRYYYAVEGEYTVKEFQKICTVSRKAVRSEYLAIRDEMDKIFEYYKDLLHSLGPTLTLDGIRIACTQMDKRNNASFVGVWENRVEHLMTDDNGKRWTTGESYKCALNSWNTILGKGAVKGFQVNINVLRKWDDGMKNGVMRDGALVGKIADATRGIYLRSCRSIWNECVSLGYLVNAKYPFSNRKEKGLIAIPVGARRKACYLNVEKMTELYKIFIEKRYPETWSEEYKTNAHYSLGLFLVQYLGNGMNLIDVGQLQYNDFYYNTDCKALSFNRSKTRERSDDGSEVIVPLITPLQKIIDDIGAKPEKGAYVFPGIYQGTTDDKIIRKNVKQENKNIQDRVIKIAKEVLDWDYNLSSTWSRHSFATNLKHAHVEEQYISECMGHSTNKTVTSIYLARYPLETQFEYNSLLLDLGDAKQCHEPDIENMSPDEMKVLLRQLLSKTVKEATSMNSPL